MSLLSYIFIIKSNIYLNYINENNNISWNIEKIEIYVNIK